LRGDDNGNFLEGGEGADILVGRGGGDFADYQNAATGVTANLANSALNTGEAQGDVYFSIENLRGSAFDDVLVGDNGNNFLRGGLGADMLDGGNGSDFADYNNSAIGLTVNLSNPAANTGEAAGDTYVSIENIRGGAFDDVLVGDSNNNFLRGGNGADMLDGGDGSDFADYIGSSTGLTVNLANPTANTGEAFGDTYVSIENIRGSNFADILIGDNGNNILRGGLGADVLNGGDGSDSADYSDSGTAVTVNLANSALNTGEAAGDTFISIENIRGSSFNDTLTGDSGDNILRGRGGADALDGGDGSDTADYFFASTGVTVSLANPASNTGEAAGDTFTSIENLRGSDNNDNLTGDGVGNTLQGMAGNDTLDGGAGDDRLVGGDGADVLTGGADADTFVFQFASDGVDEITDFESGVDTIEVSASGFGGNLVAGGTVDVLEVGDLADASGGTDGYFILDNDGADAGTLYWDPTGGTSDDATAIAVLQNTSTLLPSDFDVV